MKKIDSGLTEEDWALLIELDYDNPPYLSQIERQQAQKLIDAGYAEANPTSDMQVRRTDKGTRLVEMRRRTRKIK